MKRNLISANEIAAVLGIQCQTVYLWVRQKRIPFYRVGRLVKFDEDEVLARFKTEAEGDNKQSPEEESLTVQTSRGRQSVKRFTISNHRTIDPRRAQGSESSQNSRTKTALHGHAGNGKVALLLVRGCTAKKGAENGCLETTRHRQLGL